MELNTINHPTCGEWEKKIIELQNELDLRDTWVKHHRRVSEMDAQKKYDVENKYQEAVKDIEWALTKMGIVMMYYPYVLEHAEKLKAKYGLNKQEK